MKRLLPIVLSLIVIGVVGLRPAEVLGQRAAWVTLFNGTSLDGWNPIGNANWELVDGAVQADMGSGFLVTDRPYSDFELTLEFWVDEPANSGIFIRCADPTTVTDRNSYEVNIYDTRADQSYRTGGIVHIASPTSVINAGGQWNTYEITAQGERLRVTLNGTEVVDVEDSQFESGPIALQYGAGVVKFRNVRLRTL